MGKNRESCLTRYNTLGVKAGDDREYYEIEVDGNYTCEEFSHEELVVLHELIERAMEEKDKKCIFHRRSSYNLYGLYLYASVRRIEAN